MVWVMEMDEFRKRKTPRYQSYDYNHAGAYFITICTQNRRSILSRIVGTGVLDCPSETGVLDCPFETGGLAVARSRSGENDYQSFSNTLAPLRYLDCPQPELTRYGEIADKYIKQLNDFYEHLSVEKYVIMPNHFHFLLWVKENKNKTDNGQSRTPVPTRRI